MDVSKNLNYKQLYLYFYELNRKKDFEIYNNFYIKLKDIHILNKIEKKKKKKKKYRKKKKKKKKKKNKKILKF